MTGHDLLKLKGARFHSLSPQTQMLIRKAIDLQLRASSTRRAIARYELLFDDDPYAYGHRLAMYRPLLAETQAEIADLMGHLDQAACNETILKRPMRRRRAA